MTGSRELTTTVVASTQIALTSNLKNDTTINLGDDILLTSTKAVAPSGVIINDAQAGLVIDGLGLYVVNGQNAVRCFYISGGGANVVIQNLVITKGSGNGGGFYIQNEAEVLLKSCTITMNNGIGTVANIGGGMYITSATVTLTICAVVGNRAHRGGGIELEDGRLLLAGCLFADNKNYGASDLQANNGSDVTVLSSCTGDSYNAGQGTLECAGCSTTYPADLLSGECTACPTIAPYSCCGARDKGECTVTNSSACTENENYVCSVISPPQLAPSILPTPLPLPPAVSSAAPTSLNVLKSSPSATFTALVVIATTAAIAIAIILRWCFTSKIGRKLPSNHTTGYTDSISPFLGGPQNHVDFDYAPEYIYAEHIDDTTEDSQQLPVPRRFSKFRDIASTYGAEQTFEGSSEHEPGEYDHGSVPFDVLISHLNRHGLEVDVAEEVAVYFSVSFGVQSVGDFRLLEEADVVKAAEDLELLKIPASRLRIAWR